MTIVKDCEARNDLEIYTKEVLLKMTTYLKTISSDYHDFIVNWTSIAANVAASVLITVGMKFEEKERERLIGEYFDLMKEDIDNKVQKFLNGCNHYMEIV